MYLLNENGEYIGNDIENLPTGEIVSSENYKVFYHYVLEKPAVFKEVVVAEYPETGGKDIERIVVEPEIGHWTIVDQDSGKILDFPITYDTDNFPKEIDTPDEISVGVYHIFSEKELEELIKEQEEEAELQKNIRMAPEKIENLQADQEDIILAIADIIGGAI